MAALHCFNTGAPSQITLVKLRSFDAINMIHRGGGGCVCVHGVVGGLCVSVRVCVCVCLYVCIDWCVGSYPTLRLRLFFSSNENKIDIVQNVHCAPNVALDVVK
jgi:hypothetical protein